VFGRPRGRRKSGIHIWATLVVLWVLTLSPTHFRFARSRWSCGAVAVVLREDFQVTVGREAVRRWLRDAGLVWRRPRPTIRPKDPDREAKLAALRTLLNRLPDDETAVFMDEVDVNLNPKVGCQWMKYGEQAAVETPGSNEKRYLAGSIHWRTGRVVLTEGRPREGGVRPCSVGTWTTSGGRSGTTGSSTSCATTPAPTRLRGRSWFGRTWPSGATE
jgi:hypothetical protein